MQTTTENPNAKIEAADDRYLAALRKARAFEWGLEVCNRAVENEISPLNMEPNENHLRRLLDAKRNAETALINARGDLNKAADEYFAACR